MPAKTFTIKVLAHVYQDEAQRSLSAPQFGGWFARVKSANLDGQGSVGVPSHLLNGGVGPFDTYPMAAEKAAFAQLAHMNYSEG